MEARRSGAVLRVAPVGHGRTEVAEGSLDDVLGYFGCERVVLAFACVESFAEVLPGGPFQPVGSVESVGGDAEVVHKAADADGAAAVVLLFGRGVKWDGMSGGVPTLRTTGSLRLTFAGSRRHAQIVSGIAYYVGVLAPRLCWPSRLGVKGRAKTRSQAGFKPRMTCESSKSRNRCHSAHLCPLWRFLRKIG